MGKPASINTIDKQKTRTEEATVFHKDYEASKDDFLPPTKIINGEAQTGWTMPAGQMDAIGLSRCPPVPFQIIQFRIAVLVLEPQQKTKGGVLLTRETLDTEATLSNVGVLVSKGRAAWKSVTRAGINLADEPFNPELGEYVLFPQHAGTVVTVLGRGLDGEDRDIKFRIMNDSDVLGVTRAPYAFRYYL